MIHKHIINVTLWLLFRFQQFGQEPLIWQEVQALTKPNNNDPEAAFLQEMFSHIPQGINEIVSVFFFQTFSNAICFLFHH
jgi:hypothetical protein